MEHLTEASIPNLLILAGLVFLVVGVFGKVGGFIGNILGQIQAGEKARILAGVLGAALVVVGIYMHAKEPTPTPGPTANPQPGPNPTPVTPAQNVSFAGVWTDHDNMDKPKSFFRLEIQQSADQLSIHAWGGCTPAQNCDWGVGQATLSGDSTEVTFPNDTAHRKLKLTLSRSGELLGATMQGAKQVGSPTFVKSQ